MRLHARTLHMAQLTFWTSSRHTVRQMQMNTRIHTWMSHFCTRPRWRPLNESSVRIPSSVSSFLERPRYSTAVSRKYLIVTYLNRSTLLEKERNVLFVGVAKRKEKKKTYCIFCAFKCLLKVKPNRKSFEDSSMYKEMRNIPAELSYICVKIKTVWCHNLFYLWFSTVIQPISPAPPFHPNLCEGKARSL